MATPAVPGALTALSYEPRLGAIATDGGVSFRVWAPAQEAVSLAIDGLPEIAMRSEAGGHFAARVTTARPGQRYRYRLRQGLRADPASRFQPEGPLGPSEIVDPRAFAWTDQRWRGIAEPHRHVIYEMHIGTFTPEGTWAAATRHLPDLADVGVTTLEIMPINEFAGAFGWGYDGVHWFAPTRLYGTPDEARQFVDIAHGLGLAVILDVVYNHFGPVGNFMPEFSQTFLGKPGEWGDSINFDGPGAEGVRAFVIENAAYWIAEFHFDGLRLDAAQDLEDRSSEHIVSALCRSARAAGAPRTVFITAENERQDPAMLTPAGRWPDGVDAIWNEDWHHAACVALTGRRQAYFTDYTGEAPEFAAMARHGFLYQGQWYSWQKQPRGGYAMGRPGASFVSFLENHDQVANTGLGRRLYHSSNAAQWRVLTALLLLGPSLPMLFQGQEFASSRPFAYFASHEPGLAAAVRKGREEFLQQFPSLATPELRSQLPDPASVETFMSAKLCHDERVTNAWAVRLHRDLLRLRRTDVVLARVGTPGVAVETSAPAPHVVLIRYAAGADHRLLVVNLGLDYRSPMNDPLLASYPGTRWVERWSSEAAEYGGSGVMPFDQGSRWLLEGHTATFLTGAPDDAPAA